MSSSHLQMPASWQKILAEEFNKSYFKVLNDKILEEQKTFLIHPPQALWFNAFNTTLPHEVKVIIVGQDPYHGPKQANGLSFSVNKGIGIPPSLRNIYKELQTDLAIEPATHGDLSVWAQQGVFLINSFLTVRDGEPASHRKIGWENFTNAVISRLSEQFEGLVFMLWGNFARSKKVLVDIAKHHVLEAAHPSPFSANNGFFGCGHFSKANEILVQNGKTPIDWQL